MSNLPEEFNERLARVMKLVRTQRTLPTRLEAAVALAKRTVPTCDAAGVSMVIIGQPMTSAATDQVVLEVDLVQYDTGEGPCLEAIASSGVVRVDLIQSDIRYRRFAPGALDTGINSIISFPLVAHQRTVGALNLYSHRHEAFDEDTERVMAPIIGYTADILATSPLYAYSLDAVEGLVETLDDRAAIDQATGVLMVQNGLSSADALDAVRDRALVHGVSLRRAADAVLEALARGENLEDQAIDRWR